MSPPTGSEDSPLRRALCQVLGGDVLHMTPLAGGDINEAYKVEMAAAGLVFVKANRHAPGGLFSAEAAGLCWLGEAAAIKVPQVLAVAEPATFPGSPAFLALAYVEARPPGPGFAVRLGRQLAALHAAGAPSFGWSQDNFIATLPQPNASNEGQTWAAFYREQRLEPQLQRAYDGGYVNRGLATLFRELFLRMEDLVGAPEPPARLHGDLWAGNHLCDQAGDPVLFDPAVYGGHREVDLAMMRLFGGYPEATFAAYHEAFPLLPGHRQRVALYQLYPLLVHVNLFQGGYVHQLEAAVREAFG